MITRDPHLEASAKTVGAHGSTPRKDLRAATDAVRETATAAVPGLC
ncbi:hypothetical protein [Streptomyces sp. NPDC002057]